MPAVVPPARPQTPVTPSSPAPSSPAAHSTPSTPASSTPTTVAALPDFREAVFDTPVPSPTTNLPFVLSYSLSPEAFPGLEVKLTPDSRFLSVSWPVAEKDGPYDAAGTERATFLVSTSCRFYLRV